MIRVENNEIEITKKKKEERETIKKKKLTLQEINKTDKTLISKIRKRRHKLPISGRRGDFTTDFAN